MPGKKHRALAVIGAALIASAFVVPGAQAAEDPTQVTINAGVLSLGDILVGDFDALNVTGTEQETKATMDPFTVSDLRGGAGAGWQLTAQASQFTSLGGNTIPTGSLEMLAPAVDPQSILDNVAAPPIPATGPHTLDNGSASTIATAAAGVLGLPSGTGDWTFLNVADSLTLTVPADVIPYTYSSTVTMTVSAAP